MRRAILIVAIAGALAACGAQGPAMSVTEADRVLTALEQGRSETDVCTEAGRATFRSAVRTLSADAANSGREWPDMRRMFGGSLSQRDGMVLAALAAGFIAPDDLTGHAQRIGTMMNMNIALRRDGRMMREGLQVACNEVFALFQYAAREQIAMESAQRALRRASERNQYSQLREMSQRYVRRQQEAQRQIARLTAAIQERIDQAKREGRLG